MGMTLAVALSAWLGPLRAGEARSAKLRRGYAQGRFGQLHYRIVKPVSRASRPPLLCLHDSRYSGRMFDAFLNTIGTDRVAVAADTPGFGDSDPPPALPAISDYAAAMVDLMDAMEFDEIDVLGSRTGSLMAVELALQRPRRVRRVVMISAPVFTEVELAGLRAQFAPVTLTRDDPHLADAWVRYMADAWARNVARAMAGWTLDHLAEQFPDVLRRPDISWWGHNAAFDYPLAARLPEVQQPTLVLNPEDDLHQQTARAGALLVNGRVHELPGWGLGFLDIRTEQTANLVRAFLDR